MKPPTTPIRSTDTDRLLRLLDRFCGRTLWILLALAAILLNARLDAIADGTTAHAGQGSDRPMQQPITKDGGSLAVENAHAHAAP